MGPKSRVVIHTFSAGLWSPLIVWSTQAGNAGIAVLGMAILALNIFFCALALSALEEVNE